MSNRYAVLDDNTVTNVILWDGETELEGSDLLVPCGDEPVSLGWTRDGDKWIAPEPEPEPVIEYDYVTLRQTAYESESDPLYFKWQRGEATEQEWLDKVQEIRERYPHHDGEEPAPGF